MPLGTYIGFFLLGLFVSKSQVRVDLGLGVLDSTVKLGICGSDSSNVFSRGKATFNTFGK